MSPSSEGSNAAQSPIAAPPSRGISGLLHLAMAKLGLATFLRVYAAKFQGALGFIEALAIAPGLWLSPPRSKASPRRPPERGVRLFADSPDTGAEGSDPQQEGTGTGGSNSQQEGDGAGAGPGAGKGSSRVVAQKDPEYYASRGIQYQQGTFVNSRGMKLFTTQWAPAGREPLALIFLLHGYAVDCGIFWEDVGMRVAKHGYAAFGIDYEGHGQSDGLHGYLPNINWLADDVAAHFRAISERREHRDKKKFLLGHSLGGAMSILLSWRLPSLWDGAVLLAPMVKISDKLKPPEVVVNFFRMLERVGPTWPITPTGDVFAKSVRDPSKRDKIRGLPTTYKLKPRLHTMLELKNVSDLIESKLPEVVVPFLVLHGSQDVLIESAMSEELYNKASSADKTIKIYPGMWHCLAVGEMDANIDLVFEDAFSWISRRL